MAHVLVVLPFYGGSLPIGRFAVEGLKEIGCSVTVFDSPQFYSAYTCIGEMDLEKKQRSALETTFFSLVSQSILALVAKDKPDLVLAMAQAPLNFATLETLRDSNIPTAMWFVEDHMVFPYWKHFAPYYSLFAVIQKEPFFRKLESIGQKNHLYLPLAALPSLHKKQILTKQERSEYGSLLSFLGAGYPNRCAAFTKLRDYDFKIWGTGWEDAPELAPLLQRGGARISSEDAVKIYNATTINLNLHSSVTDQLVTPGDFVNPRTFELACSEAFQLVDTRSLMDALFNPDELATFSNFEELKACIKVYGAHPEKRNEIIAKSKKRILKDHTYAKRMTTLLEFAAERIPGFGTRQRHAVVSSDAPQEMQQQYAQLLQTLNLPSDAALAQIIPLLQSKQERCTEMEAALLYLDAWRKEYLKTI